MLFRAKGQLDAEAAVVSVAPRRLLQAFLFNARARRYGVDGLVGQPSREIPAVARGARTVVRGNRGSSVGSNLHAIGSGWSRTGRGGGAG